MGGGVLSFGEVLKTLRYHDAYAHLPIPLFSTGKSTDSYLGDPDPKP